MLCGAARRTPQVSNLGRVRKAHGIIARGSERPDGHRMVKINDKTHSVVANGKRSLHGSLHGKRHLHRGLGLRWLLKGRHQRQEALRLRFVAQAFLPPPPSEKHTQVTHIDGDPANNCADNLEWVTPLEIIQHPLDTNAERKSNAPKQSKPVLGRRHGSEEELPAEAGRRLRVQVGAAGGGPARQARRGVAGGAAVDIDCDRLR